MPEPKGKVFKWLNDNVNDSEAGLSVNKNFIHFLKEQFLLEDEDKIAEKIRKCHLAFKDDFGAFARCIEKSLEKNG
jgi:hypothetical protein